MMSGYLLGLIVEGSVAILLLITIGFCRKLARQLAQLRADEDTMRTTISDLTAATARAERAIMQLKATGLEIDQQLSTEIRDAERLTHELAAHRAGGEDVVARLALITRAAGTSEPRKPGQIGGNFIARMPPLSKGRAA